MNGQIAAGARRAKYGGQERTSSPYSKNAAARIIGGCFFFSSRRRHTRLQGDWSSDVCSSDLGQNDAMQRVIAVSRDTVGSDNLYSSIVTTAPGGRTEVHHHGKCETSIYILKGDRKSVV